MSAHEHSLSCLKTAGHVLYCEVTGDVGLELPKRQASVIPWGSVLNVTPPAKHQAKAKTSVIPWGSVLNMTPPAERQSLVPASPPAPFGEKEARALGAAFRSSGRSRMFDLEPKRSSFSDANGRVIERLVQAWYDGWDSRPAFAGKRAFFTIQKPHETARHGMPGLAYPYSLATFEGAKAKALELLARMTRTPYLTVISHVPGQPVSTEKIERSALGAEPDTHYAFYPGYARDAGIEAPTLPEIKKLAEAHLKEHPEESDVLVYAITPGRGSPIGKQITRVRRPISKTGETLKPGDADRDEAIRLIREGLKKRSGKEWSVKGGTGTAWGWIRISSPPARRVNNNMTEADMAELGKLLDLGKPAHHQGESVAASPGHRVEYIDRAWGRKPSKYGEQYWD
jgi:hypothetical protein